VNDLNPSLVIFHRISAGDQQRVDITSNAAKSLVRHDLQAAICNEQSLRGAGDDFNGIYCLRARLLLEKQFIGASENLEWPGDVKNLAAGCRDQQNTARLSGRFRTERSLHSDDVREFRSP
jgi:hypothetical protein